MSDDRRSEPNNGGYWTSRQAHRRDCPGRGRGPSIGTGFADAERASHRLEPIVRTSRARTGTPVSPGVILPNHSGHAHISLHGARFFVRLPELEARRPVMETSRACPNMIWSGQNPCGKPARRGHVDTWVSKGIGAAFGLWPPQLLEPTCTGQVVKAGYPADPSRPPGNLR